MESLNHEHGRSLVTTRPDEPKLLFLVAFSLCFIIFAGSRFYQLESLGVQRGDAFEYIDVAQRWLTGDIHASRHGYFRPAAHAIHAFGLWLVPEPKIALKLVNCFADVAAVLCVYFTVLVVTGKAGTPSSHFPST